MVRAGSCQPELGAVSHVADRQGRGVGGHNRTERVQVQRGERRF